jgi:hypothetical protein
MIRCSPDSQQPRGKAFALETVIVTVRRERCAIPRKVSRQSTSRWYHDRRNKDFAALHGSLRAGRKPKLTPGQLSLIEKALLREARANGHSVDLWTLPRTVGVIEAVTGGGLSPGARVATPATEERERAASAPKAARMGCFPGIKRHL